MKVRGCNLKSLKDTVQEYLLKKNLREGKLIVSSSFVWKPIVSNFGKLTLPFKKYEDEDFAKVDEVNEVEEIIEFKLDKLLGTFNI
ncbi:hypothetical protein BHO_0005300 (plasmid) [Borrelia hermsii YBT]|uniref:hypothetical protein n=1 Tax=Borrelia hermsii TaxID=140 RepID=UPI0003E3A74F|nr:hypothetical protein [Borrelia hermsii]AHH12907.1 hypothetical protein BHO_0005300 [Borrelia hermsii YBT]